MIDDLCETVAAWSDFYALCSQRPVLSEVSLRIPILDCLRGKITGTIEVEFPHPALQSPGAGRPRQIDFVTKAQSSTSIRYAIETKWRSSTQLKQQSIVDDLLRLETLVNQNKTSLTRLFILAGRKPAVDAELARQANRKSGRASYYEPLLSTDPNNPERRVLVDNSEKPYFGQFRNFAKSYGTAVPKSFRTNLEADVFRKHCRVVCWRISRVQRRSPINAQSITQA